MTTTTTTTPTASDYMTAGALRDLPASAPTREELAVALGLAAETPEQRAIVIISLASHRRVPHLFGLSWTLPDHPRPAELTGPGQRLAEDVRSRWPAWRDRGEVSRSAWLSTGDAMGVLHRASAQATREALDLVLLHLPGAEVRGADLLNPASPITHHHHHQPMTAK